MDYQAVRQARSETTRRAILDAAARLTREEGFDKLSVREVCAAAGVTTGAFYHHFSSKDDLLSQGFASLDDYLDKAMRPHRTAPAQERLSILLRTYAQYLEDMGWQTMALYYSHRLTTPTTASLSPNRYPIQAMAACFQELSDQGSFASRFDPAWTADFCYRHFRGVVIDWIIHQGSYSIWEKLGQDYTLFETAFQV